MKSYLILGLLLSVAISRIGCVDDDFSSPNYQAMTRQQKFDKIWSKVTEDKSSYGWYNAFNIASIFLQRMKTTFEYKSDSMPEGRKKLIHSVGVIGLVEFIPIKDKSLNPYTGVFKGCSHVLMRLSAAKKPNTEKRKEEEAEDNFIPGLSIKFLRNGVHAADSVAMYSLNGQDSWNFFKYDFSNHVAPPEGFTLNVLNAKFSEATKYTTKVGTLDMASYDADGVKESNVIFPYKLIYFPTKEARYMFSDYFSEDYMKQLTTIPEDFHLYEVYAMASPFSKTILIGKLVTRIKFTPSVWGDKNFWIRHSLMDDDFKIHPEWDIDETDDLSKAKSILEDPEFQKAFEKKYGFMHP